MSVSLACADQLELGITLREIERARADMLHIDIMDGHYVPNLALSIDLARAVRRRCGLPMDVHLMVTNPADYFERLADIGAEYVCFHPDAAERPEWLLEQARALGLRPGIALNPIDEPEDASGLLPLVDYVVVMGVKPGFHGQSFIEATYNKIARLAEMRRKCGSAFSIEIDGGLSFENSARCAERGADWFVAGALVCFGQRNGVFESLTRYINEVIHNE